MPRARAPKIEPPVLWMTVEPIGLSIVPFSVTSEAARFRIWTSVGATVRSMSNVSVTFFELRSTSGFAVVFTTLMSLILSGFAQLFVISTWRKVSLNVQRPPLPEIPIVPLPLLSPLTSK
jgi:hypothetical protein